MAIGEGKSHKRPMAAGDRRRAGHSGRVVRTVESFDGDRREKLGVTADILNKVFATGAKGASKGKTKVSKGAGGASGAKGKGSRAGKKD